MKRDTAKPPGLGITARTALLAWLVAIVTLLIFVIALLPRQKQTFLDALRSKAYGVTVSLRDVAAGAVVNEDYSTVVDHCTEMLKGDLSIDYLVITRNDGFSLVHDRSGWHSKGLEPAWRPALRAARGEIEVVPLFGRRVYAFSQPFDYSGIEWGWIHVGLSLNSYDANLRHLYQQTFLVAVACVVFSLIASSVYARWLVRPILDLQQVVRRVATGDLAARATIGRSDEIGQLAIAFNGMTDALVRRDRILESVRFAAQEFLGASDWRRAIPGVLAKIGTAAGASRAYVFENQRTLDRGVLGYLRAEWAGPGIASPIEDPRSQGYSYTDGGFRRWLDVLGRGEILAGPVATMPESERAILAAQSIRSLIAIPIRVGDRWWGFLGLDDCGEERIWTEAERDSLRAAADMFGATITRQGVQDALLEAKETLEQRVRERTFELQEQVIAKDRARAELAEAQDRLISLSREAGMAEVATGVLHNVGNVLNSVNVSTNLMRERLDRARVGSLQRTVALLEAHRHDLGAYLATDPQGRQVLGFLQQVARYLEEENGCIRAEIESVCRHVDHIKEIVAMQQNYARPGGVQENMSPAELFEEALAIKAESCRRHQITVQRDFAPVPSFTVEKHRVLQILVNLLTNAVSAMKAGGAPERRLTLQLQAVDPGRLRFVVRDTGIGIPAENLNRIFSHGFTTRRDGHGFGLHSGAIAAKTLGGGLSVSSPGLNLGATFILELPVDPPTAKP